MSFLGHSVFRKSSAEEQHFEIVTAAVLGMFTAALKASAMTVPQTVLGRGSAVEKLPGHTQARERSGLTCKVTCEIVTMIKITDLCDNDSLNKLL